MSIPEPVFDPSLKHITLEQMRDSAVPQPLPITSPTVTLEISQLETLIESHEKRIAALEEKQPH